ncbi:MAG: D-inositol-3-phosphate glycosyltransferase [Frankiaceae bacterium]|nr:D-inositol-3-phosphate glycosyltransferase [Frankiaceae bacterium]
MKILMVTPYAPNRDGIAAYAVQAVAALRAEGHDVEVLSPGPSAAHHHLDLSTPRGALALAKRVRAYDKLIVQFHPDVFYRIPSAPAGMIASHAALTAAFAAAREVEVWLHEIDYRWGVGSSPVALAARAVWRAVDRVMVHTESERDAFVEAFAVPAAKVQLGAHGAHFVRRTRHDRASARASLGVPADAFCFLSIGFVAPHKGFDRSVAAFAAAGLAAGDARLYVVGSVRLDEPAIAAHVTELEAAIERTPGAALVEGYVSDELFDRWLVACDTVVLPYRNIWSSGVLERAALYDRPVLATDVGGLAQQAATSAVPLTLLAEGPTLISSLAAAMRTAAGVAVVPVTSEGEPWPTAGDRDDVQAAVTDRAARRRGAAGSGGVAGRGRAPARAGGDTAALRRLPPLTLPPATSARFSAAIVKKTIRRLTGWEIDPVVHQVNALREAVIVSLEQRDR